MSQDSASNERSKYLLHGVGLVGLAVILYLGWRELYFLTDDAYIAFRYISNSLMGRGYVWNPAPFVPVEGYTSFLWVFLLDVVWRTTDLAPPEVANVLSLFFGYGAVFVAIKIFCEIKFSHSWSGVRNVLLFLVVLGIILNRTFLTWLSSGLETGLFNFLVISWFYAGIRLAQGPIPVRIFWIILWASLLCLCRPDGYLFLFFTVGLVGLTLRFKKLSGRQIYPLFSLWLIPIAHLLWRRYFYGHWLPNTYYAKMVEAWPEGGMRYLLVFLCEYLFWIFPLILLVAFIKRLWRKPISVEPYSFLTLSGLVLAILCHIGYYTFVVGGDHFEFRIYSYLIPLIFLGYAYGIKWLTNHPTWAVGWLMTVVLVSFPIPWVSYWADKEFNTRESTFKLSVPIAHKFPAVFSGYLGFFDRQRSWLINRFVGNRHQEHKIYHLHQLSLLPSRQIGWERTFETYFPILAAANVGVLGWVLPHAAIIDMYGLNDRVVARNPRRGKGMRQMAHDRFPPLGYVECFRPNAQLEGKRLVVKPIEGQRGELIQKCESEFWAKTGERYGPFLGKKIFLRESGAGLKIRNHYSLSRLNRFEFGL